MDLKRVSGEMISGIESEELEFLNDLFAINTDNVFNQWTGLTEKQEKVLDSDTYENIPEETLKEIEIETLSARNKNTADQTIIYVKKFRKFLENEKLPSDFEKIPVRYLSQYLRLWYFRMRRNDGGLFAPSTLICARAAIQRHLQLTRNLNIIEDPNFQLANKTLNTMISKYLNETPEDNINDREKYPAIEQIDLDTLAIYFDRSNPEKLQQEVFYKLMFHFGFRGREWIRYNLTKDSIGFSRDSEGNEYIFLKVPKAQKNVKASTSMKHFQSQKSITMYARPDELDKCPVQLMKKYLSVLPSDNNVLFPRPRPKVTQQNEWCYDKCVLGKNKLGDMMKTISEQAKLSQIYTNHSIRSTVVTSLISNGFSAKDVQIVTGHKRAESVDRYTKKIPNSKRKCLSDALCTTTSSEVPSTSQNLLEKITDTNVSKCIHINVSNVINTEKESTITSETITNKKARLHTSWGVLEIDL